MRESAGILRAAGAVALGLALGVANAGAITYQDIDAIGQLLGSADGQTHSVSGVFDIRASSAGSPVTIGAPYGQPTVYNDIVGFMPDTTCPYTGIGAVSIWLWVKDGVSGNTDKVNLFVDAYHSSGTGWENDVNATYSFTTAFDVLGGSFDLNGTLSKQGYLDYTVTAKSYTVGSHPHETTVNSLFTLDFAALVASTESSCDPLEIGGGVPASTPDAGSTVMLLGMAFLGLGALRRKMAA